MTNIQYIDRYGLISGSNSHRKGNYVALAKLTEYDITVPIYAGETGYQNRCFKDRFQEHRSKWEKYPLHYLGITEDELNSGKVKIVIDLVAFCDDKDSRKAIEDSYILQYHPYLQYSAYPKYTSKTYRGLDTCILPCFRRVAFLNMLRQEGIVDFEEKSANDLFKKVIQKIMFTDNNEIKRIAKEPYTLAATSKYMEISKIITRDSSEYKTVKSLMDILYYGESCKRGCEYPYIMRTISKLMV